jgi:hypothetical protein
VGSRVGTAIVRLFAAVDQALEDVNLFSRLLPAAIPEAVFDKKTGGWSSPCLKVRAVVMWGCCCFCCCCMVWCMVSSLLPEGFAGIWLQPLLLLRCAWTVYTAACVAHNVP